MAKKSQQTVRIEKKREIEELQNNNKMSNKMAIFTYISIIILNLNGIKSNQNTVTDGLKKKKRPIYLLSIRNSSSRPKDS